MNTDRWDKVSAVFKRIVALPPEQRQAVLDATCADDPALRREVEELLNIDAMAGLTDEFDDMLSGSLSSLMQAPEFRKGQTVSHFKILGKLGGGGMGVVYKARDLRLGRAVALKFLPQYLSTQEEAKQRFMYEAKAASALDHPNICTIYDIGQTHDGRLFITMAYYEGETIKEKIARGPLPVGQALDFATQVTDGLAQAHEAGIVHRDIKPANLMVTDQDRVKVLDFGIAKVAGRTQLTKAGAIPGTIAYMSPEQAQGTGADHRTDIWSLGVVLYEMLTGQQPFKGDYETAVVYSILHEESEPITALRTGVPIALERIVKTALAKNPEERFQRIDEMLAALQVLRRTLGSPDAGIVTTPGRPAAEPISPHRTGLVVAAALALVMAVAALYALFVAGPRTPTPMGMVTPLTTFVGTEWAPSWSPDGTQIAYMHTQSGSADISVMSLGGGEPHLIASGPHDELTPRWSPDGSKIAFISDRGTGSDIYWVPPSGGAERKLAETGIPYLEFWISIYAMGPMPWSPDGQRLLFSRLQPSGEIAIWQAELLTGRETQLTHPPPGGQDLEASWSFDGEEIAFTRWTGGRAGLWRLPAQGGEPVALLGDGHDNRGPAWHPDGRRIVFYSNRSGPYNLWEMEIKSGQTRQLTTGPGRDYLPVVSSTGQIAYTSFDHQTDLYRLEVDRPHEEHERLTANTRENYAANVRANAKQVAYHSDRTGNFEIWLLDTETGTEQQLTDDPAADLMPAWSPDGKELAFLSNRGGAFQVWIMNGAGGSQHRLTDQPIPMTGSFAEGIHFGGLKWSPDGKTIGFPVATEQGTTIWLVDPLEKSVRTTDLSGVLRFDWYGDSRRVIYLRNASDGSGTVEMRVADLQTGAEALLFTGPSAELAVAPDGGAVAYNHAASHFNMNLFMLPLEQSTTADRLPQPKGDPVRLTEGKGVWHVHGGGWSPDSKAIVYTRDLDRGDIYVIEEGASYRN